MIASCPIPVDAALVPKLMGSVDCAADGLLANGYAALAAPGGPVANALTGALTLFVGFYAYRLLLGRARLDAGQAAVSAVKIGLVLVLAGNWAAYQQIVAHTLFDAPRALAELVLGGLDRRGAVLSGTPIDALQQVFDELARDTASLSVRAGDRSPLLGGPAFATMMLNASGYAVVLSSAGMLAAARLGLALFLALGPVVAGFLLFRGTRGLVEGWLRALVALSAVSLTTTVLMAVEFTVLEPSLSALARERLVDAIRPETALAAVLVVAIFALAQLGAAIAATMLARGLKLSGLDDYTVAGAMSGSGSASLPAAAPAQHAALPRAIQIAQAMGERRGGVIGGNSTLTLTNALATAERVRPAFTPSTAGIAPGVADPRQSRPRAVRPRRELLNSRRKR